MDVTKLITRGFVTDILSSAIVIYLAGILLPTVSVTIPGVLIAAAVLAVANIFVRPVVASMSGGLKNFSFPLFAFFVNGVMLLLTAWLVPGFGISGWLFGIVWAMLLSVVITFIEGAAEALLGKDHKNIIE